MQSEPQAITAPVPELPAARLTLPRLRTQERDRAETTLDVLVRLARRAAPTSIAALVLNERDRLDVAACLGDADGERLPERVLRALMARPRRSVLDIGNLPGHPLLTRAPLGERDTAFGAFAGATVRGLNGAPLGVLFLLDREPRRWNRDVMGTLADLASCASSLLAARHEPEPAGDSEADPAEAPGGLPGRERLERYLANFAGTGLAIGSDAPLAGRPVRDRFALFRIDVGRLASLNEIHGRDAADQFLRQMADRLKVISPIPSLLAHLGGSGFALAVPGRITPADAEAMALRLLDRLREPVTVGAVELPAGPSLGFALFPADADGMDTLLMHAEAALAHAKRLGDGRYTRASREVVEEQASLFELEQDLQAAVAQDAFHLNWMPVIDTATEQVVSFEALVRWNRPGHDEVPAAVFVPVAEAAGLIEQVDGWVLREACRVAQSWDQPLGVSVNVSPLWLANGRLPDRLREILHDTGLEPERLQLEISVKAELDEAVRRELAQVRALGVRLAFDDFGTGHACLEMLTSYPFDQVKLDRQFVRRLGEDRRADTIMRSMLHMIHSLDMSCCAEGVETEAQLSFLDAHGCEEVQGYLIGRPKPQPPIAASPG